jgi:transcriptional regulator with XRE-family HTH domain
VSFARALQDLREAAGWSQVELARRSGTPINSLRNWEQGRVLPRIDAATRLARALGVSLDLLAVEDAGARGRKSRPAPRPQAKARKPRRPRGG